MVGETIDVSCSIEFMDGERKDDGRCDGGGVSSYTSGSTAVSTEGDRIEDGR
jgi:hypothetical protein